MTRRRVNDEQYGLLSRRLGELLRRVDEGAVPFEVAMKGVQNLIEFTPFSLVLATNLTVPVDYDHDNQLATMDRSKFYHIDDLIADANFTGATDRLVPGKNYLLKIFEILRPVTGEDCLSFYRKEKALLTGAQGLALVHRISKAIFPKNGWLMSFDQEEVLPDYPPDGQGVPAILWPGNNDYDFFLTAFNVGWKGDRHYLLLLCEAGSADS